MGVCDCPGQGGEASSLPLVWEGPRSSSAGHSQALLSSRESPMGQFCGQAQAIGAYRTLPLWSSLLDYGDPIGTTFQSDFIWASWHKTLISIGQACCFLFVCLFLALGSHPAVLSGFSGSELGACFFPSGGAEDYVVLGIKPRAPARWAVSQASPRHVSSPQCWGYTQQCLEASAGSVLSSDSWWCLEDYV